VHAPLQLFDVAAWAEVEVSGTSGINFLIVFGCPALGERGEGGVEGTVKLEDSGVRRMGFRGMGRGRREDGEAYTCR